MKVIQFNFFALKPKDLCMHNHQGIEFDHAVYIIVMIIVNLCFNVLCHGITDSHDQC